MAGFWIDVESAGSKVGPGPIGTATRWTSVRRLDRAGEIAFEAPATDPRTALLQEKRVVRCVSPRNNALVEMGAGIIDELGVVVAADPVLHVAGNDLLDELATRSVGYLSPGAGGTPSTTALADIMAFAPAGWSLDLVNGYSSTISGVYLAFAGESVLEALTKLAEATGEHFRLGEGRKIVWLRRDRPSSGIRAVAGGDPVALEGNPDVCLITHLDEVRDSHEIMSRIYPYGAGNGAKRLTLAGTTRTAPAGYFLDAAANYIKRDSAESAYGRIERHVSFKDVVAATDAIADQVAAANALFDVALVELQRSEIQKSYQIGITKLDKALWPGQTLRVCYRKVVDGFTVLNIDTELLVLESTIEIDASGVRTTAIQVATVDRWPTTDADVLVAAMGMARTLEAHRQPATAAGASAVGGAGAADYLAVWSGPNTLKAANADPFIWAPPGSPMTVIGQSHGITAQTGSGPYHAVQAIAIGTGHAYEGKVQTTGMAGAMKAIATLMHTTGVATSAGFGAGLDWYLRSSTMDRPAARIGAVWTDAVDASRTADLVFFTVRQASEVTERARLRSDGGFGAVGVFQRDNLAAGETLNVPVGHQMIVAEEYAVLGDLTVEGSVFVL